MNPTPTFRSLCSLILATAAITGCVTTDTQSFYHRSHRSQYALSDGDLSRLQFHISREVLAHRITADGTTSADDVIILPLDTPGTVVEVGRDWLRVAFQKDGSGIVFLASNSNDDSLYKLASEVPGRQGYHRLEGVSANELLHDGQRYRIIHGSNAYLLIDNDDLAAVIAERTHVEGTTQ